MSDHYTVTVPVPGPDGQIRYTNVGMMSPRQHHATGEVVYAITAVSGIIGIFVRFCSRSKPLYKGLRGSEQKLNQAGNRYKLDFPVGATELVACPTRRAGLCGAAGFGAVLCISWLLALMPGGALACDQDCGDAIDKLSGEAIARHQSMAAGRNNSVVLQYGAGIPVLKCRPLNFCSIQLQPGEVPIENLALGDTVLWSAEVRVSGSSDNPHVRIVIKPDAAATQTSLLIATNKRFYDVQLVNSDTDYTPVMAFTYPAEQAAEAE